MISPFNLRASVIARADLPLAVGPVMTSVRSAMAPETAGELLERQADDGRPSVHVVVWKIRGEQALEQLFHLDRGQSLARFNCCLACERHRKPFVLGARGARQVTAR